ncbi:MAG: hypothetical protein PHU63_01470 [Candidatus ainarchaeum sp.]|nr:hypothetical protein [Candidatus ainarchaeum sp.]
MRNKKAFVFSIDAFVAFSLALLALYSLVFFSAIPYNYYPSMMQAHTLAKDTLYTLSTTPSPNPDSEEQSALGYLVLIPNKDDAKEYLDTLIPKEFGYVLEAEESDGSWTVIADTYLTKSYYKKIKTVSYTLLLDFKQVPDQENPYGYNTCDGLGKPCPTESTYEPGEFEIILVRLIIYV